MSMDLKNLEYALRDVGHVRNQYEKFTSAKPFNIFSILRSDHEEVGLHSKFLFELLNPNGSHGKGNLFLQMFLEHIGIKTFLLNKVTVSCEKDNIDILITNPRQSIVIENKIYAGDQPNQLERYYNIQRKQGKQDIWLVYLKMGGGFPSLISLGNISQEVINRRLLCNSYKDIFPWIVQCIKESSENPALRESLIQYKKLIDVMTDSKAIEERKQLLYVLGNGGYMQDAHYLVNNWNHIRWHTEMEFWNELNEIIPNTYERVEWANYSVEFLNSAIHNSRNRETDYGIAFKLFERKGEDICLFIERGNSELTYGLISNYDDKIEDWVNPHSDLIKLLKSFNDYFDSGFWLAWKESSMPINFEEFNNEITLSLAHIDKRKMIVQELWKEIQIYIEQVKKVVSAL